MIRGAIFDLDGTLLDSMSLWDTMGERYLRSLGYTPRPGLNEAFRTFTLEEAAAYYRSEYGVALSDGEIIDGVNALAARYYRTESVLKPGVRGFLDRLRARGVKLCVATLTDEEPAKAALAHCGILDDFAAVLTCTQVGASKREPTIYREARRLLGTEKRETFVFEDSYYALATARRDGFRTAAIFDPHEPWQDKLRAVADCYLPGWEQDAAFWALVDDPSEQGKAVKP